MLSHWNSTSRNFHECLLEYIYCIEILLFVLIKMIWRTVPLYQILWDIKLTSPICLSFNQHPSKPETTTHWWQDFPGRSTLYGTLLIHNITYVTPALYASYLVYGIILFGRKYDVLLYLTPYFFIIHFVGSPKCYFWNYVALLLMVQNMGKKVKKML